MDDLSGKVAVVTGAASGIGLGFAEALLDEGARVVLSDIDETRLGTEVRRLTDAGGEAIGVTADVGDPESVERLADAAEARFGNVHLVCSNAGVLDAALSWERPIGQWKRVLHTNLFGSIHAVHTFVPRILASGEDGHVCIVASSAAFLPRNGIGPYNVSKSGVLALAETLAMELDSIDAPIGVTVVLPGAVSTRLARDIIPGVDDAPRLEPGMRTTADIAAQMVGAIRSRRFYLFTHPETAALYERKLGAVLDAVRGTGDGALVRDDRSDSTNAALRASTRT